MAKRAIKIKKSGNIWIILLLVISIILVCFLAFNLYQSYLAKTLDTCEKVSPKLAEVQKKHDDLVQQVKYLVERIDRDVTLEEFSKDDSLNILFEQLRAGAKNDLQQDFKLLPKCSSAGDIDTIVKTIKKVEAQDQQLAKVVSDIENRIGKFGEKSKCELALAEQLKAKNYLADAIEKAKEILIKVKGDTQFLPVDADKDQISALENRVKEAKTEDISTLCQSDSDLANIETNTKNFQEQAKNLISSMNTVIQVYQAGIQRTKNLADATKFDEDAKSLGNGRNSIRYEINDVPATPASNFYSGIYLGEDCQNHRLIKFLKNENWQYKSAFTAAKNQYGCKYFRVYIR